MKRILLIVGAFIFILTGCASVSTDNILASNIPETDNEEIFTEQGEEVLLLSDFETLTEPPALEVSTQNNVDSVMAACLSWQWSYALSDETTTSSIACGVHPLEYPENPILYTAFPAGSLPPLEEGENVGTILPVFYLDFGEVLPETVSVTRYQSSYIGNSQNYADSEQVMTKTVDGKIALEPLGDGDFVYEVFANWGETRYAYYTFRTLPQLREENEDKLVGIFDALNELEYQPYTCDGLPEYHITAPNGTVYAINFSEKWVWKENSEQAELSDELAVQLKESPYLVIDENLKVNYGDR